jgi:hypothetical protein
MEGRPAVNLSVALAKLTPRARLKLQRFQADVEDCRALQTTLQDRWRSVDHALMIARSNLGATAGGTSAMDKRHQDRLADEVAALEQQLAAVDRERNARNAALARAERVLVPLMHQFLPGLSEGPVAYGDDAAVFVDIEPTASGRPREGESVEQAIARVRSTIWRLQGEIGRLKSAPPPVADIKAKITAQVDAMAALGAPQLDLAEGHVRITWPDAASFNGGPAPLAASKLALWLHKDAILAALLASADGIEGGPPLASRGPLEVELRRQLRSAEQDEEALIEVAERQGIAVDRRFDADPKAVLGVAWMAEVGASPSPVASASAVANSVSGTVRPSALAVLRLMISSSLLACTTGRSAGFSPLRMRPV